ncbi:hypothetical protein I7I48_10577 [Histoplasma ohiense]|nr:hypothetical protein I7I48_10577 [Histoplasma ohiense (nom. inval.)]
MYVQWCPISQRTSGSVLRTPLLTPLLQRFLHHPTSPLYIKRCPQNRKHCGENTLQLLLILF